MTDDLRNFLCRPMIGQTFGHWLAIAQAKRRYGNTHWLCRCSCGVERAVNERNLVGGNSTSCGRCSRVGAESATFKHGKTGTSIHRVWLGMKVRCNHPDSEFYHRYGGRGIKVCDQWVNDFAAFEADMGPRPSSRHSLDRIDNSKGYEPTNCRWATQLEQVRNRALTLRDTDGTPISKIAEETGINYDTMHNRYLQGDRGPRLRRPVERRQTVEA